MMHGLLTLRSCSIPFTEFYFFPHSPQQLSSGLFTDRHLLDHGICVGWRTLRLHSQKGQSESVCCSKRPMGLRRILTTTSPTLHCPSFRKKKAGGFSSRLFQAWSTATSTWLCIGTMEAGLCEISRHTLHQHVLILSFGLSSGQRLETRKLAAG